MPPPTPRRNRPRPRTSTPAAATVSIFPGFSSRAPWKKHVRGPESRVAASSAPRVTQLIRLPGVDHPVWQDAEPFGPRAAAGQPVELAGGVGIAVDGEHAACLHGDAQ